jgi:transposase-like protein
MHLDIVQGSTNKRCDKEIDMSYHPTTKCREYKEGKIGRKHSYKCRQCGNNFQTDLRLTSLSPNQRI